MKRQHAPKRRDRKSGESPYARHRKREYSYSSQYHEWRRSVTGKASRAEGQRNAA
jgi:hypothetical protein